MIDKEKLVIDEEGKELLRQFGWVYSSKVKPPENDCLAQKFKDTVRSVIVNGVPKEKV